jgi:hypothetical protein
LIGERWICDRATESRGHGGMQGSEALATWASNPSFFFVFDSA